MKCLTLTYFSLLWVLVFKLLSDIHCKFASPQNCQKWFSLLPSKSVYGLLSQNHSLKENDWLSNPSSSSVIFNKHFSVVSFREKIIALLHVAGLSGNNARREGMWELCSLSFPFANSECFQQQGGQRRGEKDRACSHWQSISHPHWDKDLAMPCSIPSLRLRTSLAPRSRLALLRGTALADNSALTSIHHSYSPASFSLDTCTGDGRTSLGIIWKENSAQLLLASPSTPLFLSLSALSLTSQLTHSVLLLKSDEGLSHNLTLHILRVQPCLGAVEICLHVSLQLLRRGLSLLLCHNTVEYISV